MNRKNILTGVLIASLSIAFVSCEKNDEDDADNFDTSGTYTQVDQKARPGVATVFIGANRKNEFNTTTPSMMSAAFKTDIAGKLAAFGYTQNALGQNSDQFASLLATDVLNVKLTGTTTFFDGTNVLTGRALADDVIDTELLLIFGGPTGGSNPGLTSDNVDANDKTFMNSFPFFGKPPLIHYRVAPGGPVKLFNYAFKIFLHRIHCPAFWQLQK